MKALPGLLVALLLAPTPAAAGEDAAFGHALALVQTFIGIAAHAESEQASTAAIDDVLAGRNPEANRAAAGLLEAMTAGMPAAHRDKIAAIGRDFVALARRERPQPMSGALQARKELTEMGLRYYDEQQFLDALKRGDALAVERFVAGGGISLEELAALLSRNLPEAR